MRAVPWTMLAFALCVLWHALTMPAAAHVPTACVPSDMLEIVERRELLRQQMNRAAEHLDYAGTFGLLADYLKIDTRFSDRLGAMLECTARH